MTLINPDSTEGATLVNLFSHIKGLEHKVNGMLGWFLDIGIDPDEDEEFPGEDPTSIAERIRTNRALNSNDPDRPAQAEVEGHHPDRIPWINPDTHEGDTLSALCDDLVDLQQQINDIRCWLLMLGIDPGQDPDSITRRLRSSPPPLTENSTTE